MKKALLTILLLLTAVPALAVEPIDFSKSYALTAAGNAMVSSGGAAAAGCGGGTSYLLCENFDGSSACGDGSHTNCDVTWTKTGDATPDFNYATSPAPLEGTYSFRYSGDYDAVGAGLVGSFTPADTVYFYFIWYPTVRNLGDVTMELLDGSDNTVFRFVDAGPEFSIFCNNTMAYSTAITAGTTYHIWGDYTKGTGSNATCHLYHATTSTKPGSPNISYTSGDSTAQAAKIRFRKASLSTDEIIDKIRVSTSSIGSNPN